MEEINIQEKCRCVFHNVCTGGCLRRHSHMGLCELDRFQNKSCEHYAEKGELSKEKFYEEITMRTRHIVPCLIKKNTPELQKLLESIGHRKTNKCEDEWLATSNGEYYSVTPEKANEYPYVDCGTDESLFRALVFYTDDSSDPHQKFICIKEHEYMYNDNERHIRYGRIRNASLCMEFPEYWRKATIDEIINDCHASARRQLITEKLRADMEELFKKYKGTVSELKVEFIIAGTANSMRFSSIK